MHQPTAAAIHLSLWSGRVQLLLPTHETGGRREPRLHLRLLLRALIRLQLSARASPQLLTGTLPTAVLILSVLSSAKIAMHHHLRGLLLLGSVRSGVAHGHHQRRDELLLLLSVRALELVATLRGGAYLHHLVEVVVLVHC